MITSLKEYFYLHNNSNSKMIYFVDKYCTDFVNYKINLETMELETFNYVGALDSYRTGFRTVPSVIQFIKNDDIQSFCTTLIGNIDTISENILDFKWNDKFVCMSQTGNFFLVELDSEGNAISVDDLDVCVFTMGWTQARFSKLVHLYSDHSGIYIMGNDIIFYLDIINRKIIPNSAPSISAGLDNIKSFLVTKSIGKMYYYMYTATHKATSVYEYDFVTMANTEILTSTYEFQGMFFHHPFNEYEYEKEIIGLNNYKSNSLGCAESNTIAVYSNIAILGTNSLRRTLINARAITTEVENVELCKTFRAEYNDNNTELIYTPIEYFEMSGSNAVMYDFGLTFICVIANKLFQFKKITNTLFQIEYELLLNDSIRGGYLPKYETALVDSKMIYIIPQAQYVNSSLLGEHIPKGNMIVYKNSEFISIDHNTFKVTVYQNFDNSDLTNSRILFKTKNELDPTAATRLNVEYHPDAYLFDGLLKKYNLSISTKKKAPTGGFRYVTILCSESLEEMVLAYKDIKKYKSIDVIIKQDENGNNIEQTWTYIQIKTKQTNLDIPIIIQLIKPRGYDLKVGETYLLDYLDLINVKLADKYFEPVPQDPPEYDDEGNEIIKPPKLNPLYEALLKEKSIEVSSFSLVEDDKSEDDNNGDEDEDFDPDKDLDENGNVIP